jgi:hypothetical protein
MIFEAKLDINKEVLRLHVKDAEIKEKEMKDIDGILHEVLKELRIRDTIKGLILSIEKADDMDDLLNQKAEYRLIVRKGTEIEG